jgi:hypothetical protein
MVCTLGEKPRQILETEAGDHLLLQMASFYSWALFLFIQSNMFLLLVFPGKERNFFEGMPQERTFSVLGFKRREEDKCF